MSRSGLAHAPCAGEHRSIKAHLAVQELVQNRLDRLRVASCDIAVFHPWRHRVALDQWHHRVAVLEGFDGPKALVEGRHHRCLQHHGRPAGRADRRDRHRHQQAAIGCGHLLGESRPDGGAQRTGFGHAAEPVTFCFQPPPLGPQKGRRGEYLQRIKPAIDGAHQAHQPTAVGYRTAGHTGPERRVRHLVLRIDFGIGPYRSGSQPHRQSAATASAAFHHAGPVEEVAVATHRRGWSAPHPTVVYSVAQQPAPGHGVGKVHHRLMGVQQTNVDLAPQEHRGRDNLGSTIGPLTTNESLTSQRHRLASGVGAGDHQRVGDGTAAQQGPTQFDLAQARRTVEAPRACQVGAGCRHDLPDGTGGNDVVPSAVTIGPLGVEVERELDGGG